MKIKKVAEMSLLVIHPCLTKKIRSEGNKYRPRLTSVITHTSEGPSYQTKDAEIVA